MKVERVEEWASGGFMFLWGSLLAEGFLLKEVDPINCWPLPAMVILNKSLYGLE
jgi:hypothetical protein